MDYTVNKLTTDDMIGCGSRLIPAGSSSRGSSSDQRSRTLEGSSADLQNKSGVSKLSSAMQFFYDQNQRNDSGMVLDKCDGYPVDFTHSLTQMRKDQQMQNFASCYENRQKSPFGNPLSFSYTGESVDGSVAAHKIYNESIPLYSEIDLRSGNWLATKGKDRHLPTKGDRPDASRYLGESLEGKDDYHSGISLDSEFKYARATHNINVCSEPAQVKKSGMSLNINPDFSTMNYRENVQFSDWNLLSPENYRKQPESFVSNLDEDCSRPKLVTSEATTDKSKNAISENVDSSAATSTKNRSEDSAQLEELPDLVNNDKSQTKEFVDKSETSTRKITFDKSKLNIEKDQTEKCSDDDKNEVDEKLSEKIPTIKLATLMKKNALKNDVDKRDDDDTLSPIPTQSSRFQCGICNKSWKFKKGLNKHMKTHLKKYCCYLCNTDCTNKSQLNQHLQTHTDIKLLDQALDNVSAMNYKRDSSIIRAFPCSQCSYKAKQKKDLTKHMKGHVATKNHKCLLCEFSSKRRYSLQRHLKAVHSIAKFYECTICDFKVDSIDSFKAHIVEHSLGFPISANGSKSDLKDRANLSEQLFSYSMSQKSKCKKCEEIYFKSVEYMHHLWSHKQMSDGFGEVFHDSNLENSTKEKDNSKLMTETTTDEERMSHMTTIVSKLADITKTLNLLGDVTKGVSELSDISSLATELMVLADVMLPSFKGAYNTRNKSDTVYRNDMDDSSFMDDDFEFSSVLDVNHTTIKQECVDKMYPSTEDVNMQIQVDFNGEPVSCIQKDHLGHIGGSAENKKAKQMKCTLCNSVFTDICGLKRHLLVHVDVRPWACKKCAQTFRRKEHLKKHMVTHSADRPFVCEVCQYGAKTEERLKIHISCCHFRNKQYMCQFCSYSGRTNYDLTQHLKRHKPQNCSQCSFVCYSKSELRKHLATHTSFDCSICDFTSTDRFEYIRHEKKHAMTQYLCCELCGYSCDTLRKFKYHKLRHENKTPFECPDCDYKCSSRASYDCHRLKHAGLKPFLCSFCGSSFIKSSHLNQHMLIHKDEKSFKCSVCGYCCRTKHNMKEHEMTHSGEKPYACKYCNFSSRRKKALMLHMVKHETQ